MNTFQFFYIDKYYEIDHEIPVEDYPDFAIPENEIDAPVNGTPAYPYKIYRFTKGIYDKYSAPLELNYEILGLFRKRVFVDGELTVEEFYGTYDGTTYDDLILEEETTYTRNAVGYVIYRDKVITRYKENGGVSETKTMRKYYNTIEAIQEGEIRRTNILDDTKITCVGAILATRYSNNPANFLDAEADGRAFLQTVTTQVQQYKEGIKQPLLDAIDDALVATYPRMDDVIIAPSTTIRMLLVDKLTY